MRGRPSKYDPKYCDMLIEHMASGLSYDCFPAVIGVHKDTLYEWEKVYPDFSDAKTSAVNKNLLFWEKLGMKGMWNEKEGPSFNTTNWIFQMKNRHRWRDRQDVEVKTEDSQILDREKIRRMSTEELTAFVLEQKKEIP